MPATPEYGLRYPSLADAPNGPDAVQDLAEDVESTLQTLAPLSAVTVNAKGDLLAGTANDTVTRLAVGADGEVLTADSGAPAGLSWAEPANPFAPVFDQSDAVDEVTTSTTYTNLATVGPAVTVTVPDSGDLLVSWGCDITSDPNESPAWWRGGMSLVFTGANSIAAGTHYFSGGIDADLMFSAMSRTVLLTGLTPGSTTITAKFRTLSATSCGFSLPWVLAIPC